MSSALSWPEATLWGRPQKTFVVSSVEFRASLCLLPDSPTVSMETESQERLSARITGRVQGVGFRNFTRTHARRLGVTGWVRNERDGSVRLEAEGDRKELESLLDRVHQGPRLAHVENVEVDWSDATDEFETFRVRR